MNHGSYMIFLNKDKKMVRVPREVRKPFSFRRKENELMRNYLDARIGKYVFFDSKNIFTQE